MKAEEGKGWNVFKQIFSEHWEGFKNRYPRYSEGYYEEQAEDVESCGNPEETCPHENGDVVYRVFVYELRSGESSSIDACRDRFETCLYYIVLKMWEGVMWMSG